MKLSAKTRYATRILLELAQQNITPQPASVLSKKTDVSVQFIEQILKPLKKAGITRSVRGVAGGHLLNKPAEDITIGEVVRIMEDGIQLSLCTDGGSGPCPRQEFCVTKSVWHSLSKAMEREMDAISLADLSVKNNCL